MKLHQQPCGEWGDHSTIHPETSPKRCEMSESLIPVPQEWKKRTFMTGAQYDAAYAGIGARPGWLLAQGSGAAGLAEALTKVKNVSWDPDNLSIKWFEDGALNVSANCIRPASGQARRSDRHHLGRRQSSRQQAHYLFASCTPRSASSPMCSKHAASRRATVSPSTRP